MIPIRGSGAPMRRLLQATGFLLALFVLAGSPSAIGRAAEQKDLPSDLAQVRADSGFFMTFRAGDLAASKAGKELLTQLRKDKDNLAASMESYLGVPLADIERLTILPLEDIAIVRTTRPYDRQKVLDTVASKGQEKKHKDKTFYHDDMSGNDVYFVDDRVFLRSQSRAFGKGPLQGGLQQLWDRAARKDMDLAEPLHLAAGKHELVAGLTPRFLVEYFTLRPAFEKGASGSGGAPAASPANPVKPQKNDPAASPEPKPPEKKPAAASTELTQLREEPRSKEPSIEELLRELPPDALPYKPLLQARLATLVGDLGDELKVEVRVTFADKDIARDGETSLRTLLYVVRELLPQAFDERGPQPDDSKKLRAFLGQMQAALKAAKVAEDGTIVSAAAHMEVDPATVGTVARELSQMSQRVRIENSLHQIAFATMNYADSYQGKMPAGIFDKAGKPLLSWRVAILPYIEQQVLYKQFHLDEPWDSDHNKKLIAQMPQVYAGLNAKLNAEGKTVFLAPSGEGTAWPGGANALRFPAGFTDGTSNTILFVLGDDDHAVEWTKPEDLKIDPKKPHAGLAQFGGMFLFGMADGSVHRTKATISKETLWAAFTPSGNEVLGSDW